MPDTSYLYGSVDRGGSRPSRGGRNRNRRSRRSGSPRLVPVLLVLLVLAVGVSAYVVELRDRGAGTPIATDAAASPLLPAPVAPQRGACLDRSGSVDHDGHLGTRTARTLLKAVENRDLGKLPVPRTAPVATVPAQRLVVRLVRANSFTTDASDRYSVDTTISGVPGLSSGQPYDDGTEDYTDRLGAWDTAYAQVSAARQQAGKEQAEAAARLDELAGRGSDGSDVLGCVAAVLSSMDAAQPRDVLLVSDLADRGPGVASYPDSMKGAFAGAHLTVILACPDGVASVCDDRLTAFEDAVAQLGIDSADVHTMRAEVVNTAVRDWLWDDAAS